MMRRSTGGGTVRPKSPPTDRDPRRQMGRAPMRPGMGYGGGDSFERWQQGGGRPGDRGPTPGLGYGRGGRWGSKPPTPAPQAPQGPSLNDQWLQFLQQDPQSIGIGTTQSLSDIMGDYAGGFEHGGQGYDAGNTMQQTIRNKFLGTLDLQDRARTMNHMGYFTGGQRVNAPQGGFQFSGSLPELDFGGAYQPQNNGVTYGTYSRASEAEGGGYSWDAIGDRTGAFSVAPGTTDPARMRPPGTSGGMMGGPRGRTRRTRTFGDVRY